MTSHDRSRGPNRRQVLAAGAAGIAALAPAGVGAQERFPSRTIRIIVPLPAPPPTYWHGCSRSV
jgi:hypothetical protein